ncbi:MAG TPA: hypothetical protein VLK34_07430 [Nocardioidaceae bacterium]|nr:hypothetical protein [Nocardioidaceae bacterium]
MIYPQRCDLSPDGRIFCYFTLKKHADWPASNAYLAMSRLPWLTALAAWGVGSTWTRGAHFVSDRSVWEWGDPDVGDAGPCREKYGLAHIRPGTFAVERRRGWTETADTPPRRADDMWDEHRQVALEKPSPTEPGHALRVSGWYAAHRALEPERFSPPAYALDGGSGRRGLDGVWWADWSPGGDLLIATEDGRLQRRSPDGATVRWEHDLSALVPDPTPPPADAARW